MRNKVSVTIGIPFYNAGSYLELAIQSVLNQSFKDFELILLDDGSTDSSLSIAKGFKDDRITVISDGCNNGLAYRLNQLVKLAKGKYFARMDADDIMHFERIRKQYNTLLRNTYIDVLGSNAYSIDDNNRINGVRMEINNNVLSKVNSFIHPTIMAETKWFLHNPYDVEAIRIEDAELWYRTSKKYKFMVLREPLLFYREFGLGYYKKYFKGIKTHFVLSFKYFQKVEIRNASYWLITGLLFSCKGLVYFSLNKLGRENKMIEKRNINISESEEKNALKSLRNSIF